VDADPDTLATALYVRADDLLKCCPERAPWRPAVGITPRLSDAELLTLAVMQALLGFRPRGPLAALCPQIPSRPVPLPARPARIQQTATQTGRHMRWLIRMLARDNSLWTDDVWIVDSTPVECGRSKDTVRRSELAGYAEYGYCPSHSRYFWGLRPHLLTTLHGLPVRFALTGTKADERQVLLSILDDTELAALVPGHTLIGDKNYGRDVEANLTRAGLRLLRPARRGEPEPHGSQFFKPLRQIIESVNNTFKGQLGLERHGGHTPAGVITRILQRILALTAAIWHNDHTTQPVMRSLIADDHC
jgi:Transposase DDE domain